MIIAKQGQPVLGIDIGKVITGDTDNATLFTDGYLAMPEVEGAFKSIRDLYDRFDGFVYLISKCRGPVQVKTRHWLSHHGFYEATGVPKDHVFFCEKREGKHPLCMVLRVTHAVDDRLEVLGYLKTVRNRYLFRPDERKVARNKEHLPHVIRVESWAELLTKI